MVFNPNGIVMTCSELAKWANTVHQIAGGKGNPFTENMIPERLKGDMCSCGTDSNGISLGEFVLLPLFDESVREGGKAYMQCKKCGCWSHL